MEEQKEGDKLDAKLNSEAQSNMDGDDAVSVGGQGGGAVTVTQQEIVVKVDNFEIRDKTEEVIHKLRKINKLFDRQRNLTKQKEVLIEFKESLKARYGKCEDGFKDKSAPCRKISQRLRLC